VFAGSASLACIWIASSLGAYSAPAIEKSKPAQGPLRVHPENGRFFTDGTRLADGSLKTVYLTGSHTWANLIDRGPADPPPEFHFDAYLDLLQRSNHNFIRLWSRQVSWYHGYGDEELHAGPLAWTRTGPGNALDAKPRFDLTKLHTPYFERLRARIIAARDRGIYVGVMLFGGNYECQGGWRGNPFHVENNVNGINGDPDAAGHGLRSHTLTMPRINELQEDYVRKVIDTLNDLDNVLYEISNEGHPSSAEWQKHWIHFIKSYEAVKPKQHPVGMTALYVNDPRDSNRLVNASAADWSSPLTDATGVRNIAATDGSKVSILDSDHWFVKEIYRDAAFGREWIWKAFCRGHNPVLMEHLPPLSFVDRDYPLTLDDPGYSVSRRAMGDTRQFATRMKMAAMRPANDLASSGFCLANPGKEYLVYKPMGETNLSVELQEGGYEIEWFDPVKHATARGERIRVVSAAREFKPPFPGEAVLYLKGN
jgi:hypothetical protein